MIYQVIQADTEEQTDVDPLRERYYQDLAAWNKRRTECSCRSNDEFCPVCRAKPLKSDSRYQKHNPWGS